MHIHGKRCDFWKICSIINYILYHIYYIMSNEQLDPFMQQVKEEIEALIKKRDMKQLEVTELETTTIETLWKNELTETNQTYTNQQLWK